MGLAFFRGAGVVVSGRYRPQPHFIGLLLVGFSPSDGDCYPPTFVRAGVGLAIYGALLRH